MDDILGLPYGLFYERKREIELHGTKDHRAGMKIDILCVTRSLKWILSVYLSAAVTKVTDKDVIRSNRSRRKRRRTAAEIPRKERTKK